MRAMGENPRMADMPLFQDPKQATNFIFPLW